MNFHGLDSTYIIFFTLWGCGMFLRAFEFHSGVIWCTPDQCFDFFLPKSTRINSRRIENTPISNGVRFHPYSHRRWGDISGIASAIFLAWQAVTCVLIEKHTCPSQLTRFIRYTPRVLESFNCVRVATRLRMTPKDFALHRVKVGYLIGK